MVHFASKPSKSDQNGVHKRSKEHSILENKQVQNYHHELLWWHTGEKPPCSGSWGFPEWEEIPRWHRARTAHPTPPLTTNLGTRHRRHGQSASALQQYLAGLMAPWKLLPEDLPGIQKDLEIEETHWMVYSHFCLPRPAQRLGPLSVKLHFC